MSHRLEEGGLIDRSRTLSFAFDGRSMLGHPGDTLASALIANDVKVVGRSLKYHRPRGFFGDGLEDPNSMLAVRDGHGFDPALRAGQVALVDALEARSVTGWPSPRFDVGAAVRCAAPMLGAGFYYKTFMWPNWSWFEGPIKRMTGFGRVRDLSDRRRREHRHDTCDVLIIGAGPAGLAAARALSGRGFRVLLADDGREPGGCLLWEEGEVDGRPACDWVRDTVAALEHEGVHLLTSTLVCGAYESGFFTLMESLHDEAGVAGERLWKLRARQVVMATGAVERPMVFQNNDRPGITLSAAARRYLGQYGVAPGRAIAIYTNNDSGYLTAIAARRAGLEVPVVIDTRCRQATVHAGLSESHSIPCVFDASISDTDGSLRLKNVSVTVGGKTRRFDCDALAVAGGWTPSIQLAAQRGSRPVYDPGSSMFLCPDPPEGWRIVGGAAGELSLTHTMQSGHAAGEAIAGAGLPAPVGRARIDYGTVSPAWWPQHGKPKKMWLDFQKDVKVSDVILAAQENYASVEHLKRYTTLGMGTDQGRTSNVNGLAILAGLTGRDIAETGTTTFRPPVAAMRMSAVAHRHQGDLYQPRRRMPAHDVHAAAGAVFDDFGWERPDWFRDNGVDREEAVHAEMAAVRNTVGVFDGSPLGKIEVAGPDARAFLNRFYISNLRTLKAGRVRYSIMLKEDGVILDDGVVTCIDENLFLASPTSGNAEAIAAWLERWRQTEWPGMQVAVAPVTSSWATVALAGPRARNLLSRLGPDTDVSADAFRHMRFHEGTLGGVPARIARVSFTGELQYEVSVPARYGASLVQAAMESGGDMRARRIGMEAWLRLRLEKGYIHVGADTDGRTTPDDIGMGAVVAKKDADFIGKRSLSLPFALSEEREQLVGLRSQSDKLSVGGRILLHNGARPPCPTVGYITSACTSPTAGYIAMALVERGFSRQGETVQVYDDDGVIEAEICPRVFVDPDNEGLHA